MTQIALKNYADLQTLFPAGKNFSYRPIIVWAMNDKLCKKELERQLVSFKDIGYGGAMVMPWGGLPYDFMCDEWLDAVRHIMQCASKLNIDVWIWDDWIFGSGTAGGKLTKNTAYRAKTLKVLLDFVIEPGESVNFMIPPRAVSGSIFPANKFGNPIGKSFEQIDLRTEQVNITTDIRKRIMIVGWEYVSGMQHSTKSHGDFFNPDINEKDCDIYINCDKDFWSVDMMKPEAITQYLKLIHERYWNVMPEFFGNTFKGFFYDEPKTPTNMPWTEDFAERFGKIKGYDILQYLPSTMVVYLQDGGNFTDKFRPEEIKNAEADYRDVWTTLVAETFYGIIQSWCKKHNVMATGHPIGDNSLEETFSHGGCYFKNMMFSDMPGVDTVGGYNDATLGKFFDFPRLSGSRATLLGKPRAMSESFAVFGHGVHIDQMRYTCEHQIIRGITAFFCKLSNYNRERSFYFHPPELSEYNPVTKHFGSHFCQRINNIASLMNSGNICSPRVALYIGTLNCFYGDKTILKQTTEIAKKLAYNQVEFDYIWDQDVIDMQFENSTIVGKFGQSYCYIVLPENILVSPAAKQKIISFENAGAVCKVQHEHIEDIIAACKNKSIQSLQSISKDVKVSMRTRILENGIQCCMLLNESDTNERLMMQAVKKTNIFEINLNTWQVEFLMQSDMGTALELSFMPSESRILLYDTNNKFTALSKAKYDKAAKEVVIDRWTVKTPDGKKINLESTLPTWEQLGFPGFTGFMRYSGEFVWDNKDSKAMLSFEKLNYTATVWLDGCKVGDCIFTPFELPVGNLIAGKHLLEIDVLNTQANSVFGDEEKLQKLRSARVFKGTYAPLYEKLDMAKLRSGLLGHVKLLPIANNNH